MKKRSILRIDCSEAAEVCNKAEYKEAGFLEKLKLKFHLFACRNCKKYNQRNSRLSSLLRKASIHTCTEQEKEAFKKQMEDTRKTNS